MSNLSHGELADLIRRVFAPRPSDGRIGVLVDLPDGRLPDVERWRDRRALGAEWAEALDRVAAELGLVGADLVVYRNARRNNADLPDHAWVLPAGSVAPDAADDLEVADALPMDEVLAAHPITIALAELSATAPLKLAARRLVETGFRAASMPRFSRAMIPALALDWVEVDRRCRQLKALVDRAEGVEFRFSVDGERGFDLFLDLRWRTGHASGGLLQRPGIAGNLPSGEAYIVPYEGERAGEPSRSRGLLPVQLPAPEGDGREVVVYRVDGNRAVAVDSSGPASDREAERLRVEPAYGNIAELGLGVLAAWGVQPVGEILLDEKLGLHIAFGRSDHLGGQVGTDAFSTPDAVVHIDRVYLPATQPRVHVPAVDLVSADGSRQPLMRDGAYAVDWSSIVPADD